MSNKPVFSGLIVLFVAPLLLCGLAGYALTAWVARETNANNARIAAEQTQQELYRTEQAAAAARQAEAEKEQALYDAAGYAIETQANLLDWYARRGDIRAGAAWQWLVGILVCGFIVWLVLGHPGCPTCLPQNEGVYLTAPRRENTHTGKGAGRGAGN